MEPLLLNITDFVGLPEGLPEPLGFLVSGESVQATVLESQDNGKVVVSVKGVPLTASSLVGQLRPGQVLQARVARTDGQILLKLDPLPLPQSGGGRQPNSNETRGAQGQTGPAGQEGLRQVAASVVRQGPSVSADRVVVQAAGREQYEAALTRQGRAPLSESGSHAMQSSAQAKAGEVSSSGQPQSTAMLGKPSVPTVFDGTSHLSPSVSSDIGRAGQAAALSQHPEGAVQAQAASKGQGLSEAGRIWPAGQPTDAATAPLQVSRQAGKADPVAHLLRTLLPADEPFRPSLDRLLKAVHDAVRQEVLPEQAGRELEQLAQRLLLKAGEADGPRVKDALIAKGLQYERSHASSAEQGGDGVGAPAASEPTLKGWLLETLKAHAKAVSDESAANEAGKVSVGKAQPGEARTPDAGWMKEARHMLNVIEREQVLNALNVQQGQPLMVEVPLHVGPISSMLLYVSQPEGDGAGQGQRPSSKPYSLVTLLELDGIGAIRVDAVLTGKRVTARFMVDRPEIDRAVGKLLPALHQGLTGKGYQVERLSSIVADPALVRGEDLPTPAAAGRNLLSMQI